MKIFDGSKGKKIKKIDDEIYDTLSSIDFLNKTFHLSGSFNGCTKKEFAEKIEGFGGNCRIKAKFSPSKTDYFVIGDDYYWEGEGGNAKDVDKHNQKGIKHIPKIKQSHCEELINQYKPPKP